MFFQKSWMTKENMLGFYKAVDTPLTQENPNLHEGPSIDNDLFSLQECNKKISKIKIALAKYLGEHVLVCLKF